MRKLILCLFVVVLASATYKSSRTDLKFIEKGYGICQTKDVYKQKSKDSPTGTQTFSDGFILIKQTDTIPAVLGQQFGSYI